MEEGSLVMPVLLGPDGEPIDRDAMTAEIAGPTMMGVRRPEADHPSIGMTPECLAMILRDSISQDPSTYFALAEEIEEKEPQYLSVLGVRKRSVAQLEISVEAGDGGKKEHVSFIDQWLKRESLEDDLFDILDAIGKGISCNELIWQTSSNQWWVDRIEWRDMRWFELDRLDLSTLLLKGPSLAHPLPAYKFAIMRGKAKSGLPIRGGLARNVAWLWLFKNYDFKGWVQFCEIYGQPIRIGKYHGGASEKERRQLLRAVTNIGRDFAAIIPQSMIVEFIESGGKSGSVDVYERLAKYCDQMISKVVLGQTTTTDAISGGHAVSKEHNEVRGDIERADAKALAAVLNDQIVKPMIDLNFGPQKIYPKICIGRAEQINIEIEAQAVSTLSAAGVRLSAKEIRRKFGYSDPAPGEEVIGFQAAEPAKDPAAAPLPLDPKMKKALASIKPEKTDIIDELAAEALADDGWEQVMQPMIDPLEAALDEAIEKGMSLQEFREIATQILPRIDTTLLAQSIERASFAARLAAQLDAEDV
jgi:phage gp29-like protein